MPGSGCPASRPALQAGQVPPAGIAQPQPGQILSLPPAGSSGAGAAGTPRAARLVRIAVMIRVRHGRDRLAAPR